MRYKILAILTILLSIVTPMMAHGDSPDFFRSIGKLYVVVAVVVVSFIGIVFFLIYIDKKISKIEKEISSH